MTENDISHILKDAIPDDPGTAAWGERVRREHRRHRVASVVVVAAAVVAIGVPIALQVAPARTPMASATGSPSQTPTPESPAGEGFWEQNRLRVQGLEANPPTSVEDLAAKSDVIAVGSITSVTKGKSYDQGDIVQETINVTIHASKLSGDLRGQPLVVEWDRSVEKSDAWQEAPLPNEEYIFFLDHHPDYPTLICTSTASCVLAVDPDGTVSSPRSPDRIPEFPIQPHPQKDLETFFNTLTSS